MKIEELKQFVRNIPDFPVPGIQFKDVTTLFKEYDLLVAISDHLYEMYKDKGITKVVGIESRGFIIGPILAMRLHVGFVPIRKPGKLPAAVYEQSYLKEYGTDVIQIHQDALTKEDVVLIHDDLLATGGTMLAACELMKKFCLEKIFVNFIIELEDLGGRTLFDPNVDVQSLIKYPV